MFADIAAPVTDDSAVTAAADNATRTRHVDHCVTAPRPALPSAARHADAMRSMKRAMSSGESSMPSRTQARMMARHPVDANV